jgi:hypothetical protein
VLVLKGDGKLLEKSGGKQPVRHGGNILALLLVDNVVKFLLQVRDVEFHKALAVDSGINNRASRTLLDRVNESLAVEDILSASDLGEVHDGCVEGHACFCFGGCLCVNPSWEDILFGTFACENHVFMVFSQTTNAGDK